MAAKKSPAKKTSAKKKPAKKASAKKASTKKASAKKPAKKNSATLSTPKQCSDCVMRIIHEESKRKPHFDDKLSDLFVPCAADVMARLKKRLREECSDRDVEVKCSKTVERIIEEFCT